MKARVSMLLKDFFFGRLALYLKMVEDTTIPTMAVDGKHIFYNPDFVLDELTPDTRKTVLAHEIMHCVLDHINRRGSRDPRGWNIAGDYAINQILADAKFTPAPHWLLDPQYKGMSADHIYDLLPKGSKDGSGEGPGPLCDIRQSAATQSEAHAQEVEWKIAVAQAAASAEKAGALPGALKRLVDEAMTPKVPWREVLQRFISQISKDDYSWSRPNRRMLAHGFMMPGLYSERMGPIDVVIDTSGSIDGPTLNAFAAEIRAIAGSARPEKIRVIYCDAAINHIDEFEANDELVIEPHGGGGTDFRPIFTKNTTEGYEPAALVYLTDLWGPEPASAPDYPVLWCCTTARTGSFGETVKLEL